MKYLYGITLIIGIGAIGFHSPYEERIRVEHPSMDVKVQPMPPEVDMTTEESRAEAISNLILASTDKVDRENYWGDIDEAEGRPRRFGSKKNRNYYIKGLILKNDCFAKDLK